MKQVYLPIVLALASGCQYCRDRGRDALDIFNVGITQGVGVQFKTPLIRNGLGYSHCYLGIENGEVIILNYDLSPTNWRRYSPPYDWSMLIFTGHVNENRDVKNSPRSIGRIHKDYETIMYFGAVPIWDSFLTDNRWRLIQFGKIEASFTLGFGLKVGLNLIELGDFFMGYFGVDFLDDDREPE